MTLESNHRNPLEILGEEFLTSRRQGNAPTIQQFIDANRQYADQINALFPAMIAMEDLKSKRSEESQRPVRLHVDRLERLGDYRIIREVGHGGMGIVYEAEQKSLRRRVAVKVYPKQAIGDSQQLKRFQREAETVGALHHTNIVPVFGVGQQGGLHYFVMQFLEGEPLDVLIARQAAGKPAEGQRKDHWNRIADIGIQVAEALAYAHSKGVMHRDIKPSNLIVSSDSHVWVTDFGLAVSPEHERLSRSGDVVGTLRYMSPEQLNGHSDQRSDVYGLGLTLYELMTLRPAFEGVNRGSLIRKVLSTTPPSPRSVCHQIPKDLETIILKAIARSPESRYKSAHEMAEDLRRFCDDQPILARRIGPVERLCRWSRRNPAIAGMSLALTFGALLSLGAVSWNWRQAVQEKMKAEREGMRAENNLSLALGSMDRLVERFESDWMSHPVVADSSRGQDGIGQPEAQLRFVVSDHSAAVLEEALEFYDRFAHQNAHSPRLKRDTAKAYRRVGDILARLGRNVDAELAYRRSAGTLQELLADRHGDSKVVAETAAVLNQLAMVVHAMDRSEESKRLLDQAKKLLNDELVSHDQSLPCIYQLALTNSNLGLVQWRMQQGELSTQRHRRAILLLEALAEDSPFNATYRLSLARAYRNYYPIAAVCKNRVYSCEIRDSAASILEQLVADFPKVPDYRCELSELLTASAGQSIASSTDQLRQVDRAVQLAAKLHHEFRSVLRYQIALAKSLTVQATLRRDSGPARASEIHLRAVGLLRQLRVQFPEVAGYRALIASGLYEQAVTLRRLDQVDDAIGVVEEAISEQATYLEKRPDSISARKAMSSHLRFLADTLDRAGQTDRATEVKTHARTFWKRRPSRDPNID